MNNHRKLWRLIMVLIFCNPPSNIDSEKPRFKRSFKHRLFNENDPKPFMILRPNDSYLSFSENINAEVVVADNNNQPTSHLIFLCACSSTFTTFTGGNKISQDKNTKSSNLKRYFCWVSNRKQAFPIDRKVTCVKCKLL